MKNKRRFYNGGKKPVDPITHLAKRIDGDPLIKQALLAAIEKAERRKRQAN